MIHMLTFYILHCSMDSEEGSGSAVRDPEFKRIRHEKGNATIRRSEQIIDISCKYSLLVLNVI